MTAEPREPQLCRTCQADPDPRGWTACAACRALNTSVRWQQTMYPAPGVVVEEITPPKDEATMATDEMARCCYCPINHHDTRGIIRDIFPTGAPESVTLITQRAGTVRGNHLHRMSTQHLYVVSGGIVAYHTAPLNMREIYAVGMGAGAIITHPPGAAHAYRAIVDSVLLAFAEGVRKGGDYDKDTWPLVPSLIEDWDEQQQIRAQTLRMGERLPPMRVIGDPW